MTNDRRAGAPAGVVRAQSNLVAVSMALVILTAATTLGLALADAAFSGADRPADDRRVAVALSERLVAPDAPLTVRANVLNATAVDGLDAAAVDSDYPVLGDRAFRIRLDDRTLAERGDPSRGYTMRRIVLVEERTAVSRTPPLAGDATTLPRRTPEVVLDVDPPDGTTVRTVRADGRVVLHDPSGLEGTYAVDVSRFETVRLQFEADGPLPGGSVEVTYHPARSTKALLEVTVGA